MPEYFWGAGEQLYYFQGFGEHEENNFREQRKTFSGSFGHYFQGSGETDPHPLGALKDFRMARLVHHTIYTCGKRSPLPFNEKSLIDKSRKKKKKQRQTIQDFYPIQNQWKKVWSHWRRVFWYVLSVFRPIKLQNDFFETDFFGNFDIWIITCFTIALSRSFNVFLKINIILCDR